MIKVNDVAFIKTTGEAVFVLDITLANSDPMIQYDKAYIHRPVAGQDGIQHVHETFRVAELETESEQKARFMATREEIFQKYGPKTNEAETTGFLA